MALMQHWRLFAGLALGLAGWGLARTLGWPVETRVLIGWNAGAITYVFLAAVLIVRSQEKDVRARAAREDETKSVILGMVLLAIVAALAAIALAQLEARNAPPTTRAIVAGLALLTMVSSWFFLQSVFAIHYAHRHFQLCPNDVGDKGFIFPGDPPRTYLDFAYLAICVGATAQVSDAGVGSTSLRNLVTTHAAVSFFYNTAILALGINILAGLFGG